MEKDLTKTFEFSEDDYTRIVMTESLFNDSNIQDNRASIIALKKLQEQETRLYLHAVTLSDYLRMKKIPRGLRITKKPMYGKDDASFCDRWCEVLNKCSLDLMALTIQETSRQLQTTREEIQSCKQSMTENITDEERRTQVLNECENWRQTLEKEIKEYKKQKFERDMGDYQRGAVYKWRCPASDQPDMRYKRNREKKTKWRTNFELPTASTSSFEMDSTSTNSETTFLGRGRGGRGTFRKRGRGRNAGVVNEGPPRTSGRTRKTVTRM